MKIGLLAIIVVVIGSLFNEAFSQCQNVSFALNSVTHVDDTNCPEGNGTLTLNVDGAISGGNPSFCIGYIPSGGTQTDFVNVVCFNKNGSGLPFDDVDVTISVPCNASSVGLTGWSSIGGGGTQCTAPSPISSNNLLPVTLLTFEGIKTEYNTFKLTWQTASEVDNDYFSVEQSSNGKDFKQIGRVRGNGTSNRIHTYSYVDNNPSIGVNYYRLVQYDYDGRTETFDIIALENDSLEKTTVVVQQNVLKILAQEKVNLVGLYSFDGRLVQSFVLNDQNELDISAFDSGYYIARLTSNNSNQSHKIYIR